MISSYCNVIKMIFIFLHQVSKQMTFTRFAKLVRRISFISTLQSSLQFVGKMAKPYHARAQIIRDGFDSRLVSIAFETYFYSSC